MTIRRRDFLRNSGLLLAPLRLAAAGPEGDPNPNWADPALGARVTASSYVMDPPKGYLPSSVITNRMYAGWQSQGETAGAWLEIAFDQPRTVRELWILAAPLESGVHGEDAYTLAFSRVGRRMAARKVRIGLSSGASHVAELRETAAFQIVTLPKAERTASVRIVIEEVYPKTGGSETGLGKVRVFGRAHQPTFEVDVRRMYDARDGQPVQAATLTVVNPGPELRDGALRVSSRGRVLSTSPLPATPARSVVEHEVWIPAPVEDSEMEFAVVSRSMPFERRRVLKVPRYRSYFDGGTFEIECTNHNDIAFLGTPKFTADYRSSELILPAMELMRKYPEFLYSMECTGYLMEFLERHPKRREEMADLIRKGRFAWGAGYMQGLDYSGGPERLARQFYLGRRWLKKTFPGADTRFYLQTDQPCMTQQLPQLLARAGVRYCILGRMPFGFFDWQSPDGTSIRVFGYRYYDAGTLLDPADSRGWLRFADEREAYYREHRLPRRMIYDYTSDYLPPQPGIVPYVRRENTRMQAFAKAWNARVPGRPVNPPHIAFTTFEKYLGELDAAPVELTTLRGEWPMAWAYYDEPSNREALLDSRRAHNTLLAAERAYAGLGAAEGFAGYPAAKFAEAWQANLWPDHGWGGNRGVETDREYARSFARSRRLAQELLESVADKLVPRGRAAEGQIPITVFNPLGWPRTDLVECEALIPSGWPGWRLVDEQGREVACAFRNLSDRKRRITFVAADVPAAGYRNFALRRANVTPYGETALSGDRLENHRYVLVFGPGGIRSLYDKARKTETLRTSRFEGGEILQFTALGVAWEDAQAIGMADFDRTSNHAFPVVSMSRTAIGAAAVREARFAHFTLRQTFRIYDDLARVDIDVELIDWDGTPSIELRAAFPIALDEARITYETPFGAAEVGKDEVDFSRLPSNAASQFYPEKYGGHRALAFRQALNWIDASSPNYRGGGMMAVSDSTVHLFRDPMASPADYPVLQHVLLASRQSLAWNPQYWFTQKGSHRYRMALIPHEGGWRQCYREGVAFNYALMAFEGAGTAGPGIQLEPHSLVLTAFKKSEDDNRLIVRFYEAEGNRSHARVRLSRPIKRAWRANLIEEDEEAIQPAADGSLRFPVKPWEIVTLKVEV